LLFSFDGADLIAIAEPIVVSLLVPVLLTAAGSLLLRPFPAWLRAAASVRSPFSFYVLATNLAGAAGLSIALYLLALAGTFNAGAIGGLCLAVGLAGCPSVVLDLKRLARNAAGQDPEKPATFGRDFPVAFLLVAILFSVFQLTWLPPDDSDELRYHMTIPKRYLEAKGWVEIPDQAFSHFPLGMEMLFAGPLALDRLRDPPDRLGLISEGKFIHAWFLPLCLLLLLIWSREMDSSGSMGKEDATDEAGGNLLPVWIFATIPFVPVLAAWAFVDFGAAFGWLAAAFFSWLHFRRDKEGYGFVLLAASALGWSLAVKYTSLAWWFILTVVWLGHSLLKRNRRCFTQLALIVLVPPLFASPWFFHNWMSTGNPFYPLLASISGTGFDPIQKGFYDWHSGMKGDLNQFPFLPLPRKVLDVVSLPFRASLFPEAFEFNPIGGLVPVLLPAFFFGLWKRRRDLGLLSFLCLFLFLLWSLTYRDPRFAIPLWGLLAIGIGVGLQETILPAMRRPGWMARLHVPILFLLLLWGLGQADELFRRKANYAPWIDLRKNPETYLTQRYYLHPTIREVERLRRRQDNRPALLLLGQEQSYYFDSPVRGSDYFDGPWLARVARQSQTVEQMSETIRKEGIDWVLVNRDVLEAAAFNLVRGALFTFDEPEGEAELENLRQNDSTGLTPKSIERVLNEANRCDPFRRMHAWLILHPGFVEIPLETVTEKSVPVSSFYQGWLGWPELKGVDLTQLPRRGVSLLIREAGAFSPP